MEIVEVNYLSDYVLSVKFDNTEKRIADFESFIKNSLQPMTNQFIDKQRFAKVYIENGRLTWEDGQMDISAESIYNNEFSPQ